MPKFSGVGPEQWRALVAAFLGWGLDGMDVMLYSFAVPSIRAEFGLTGAQAGWVASATLFAAAVGGSVAGWMADRIGRARTLMISILLYSLATGLIATAHGWSELVFWRVIVGLGLGAEWSAGTVLIAETWPAEHRGKAIGWTQAGWAVGYLAAALLAAVVIPRYGWRVLFLIGVLPALLVFWIRVRVREPRIWVERSLERGPFPWRGLLLAIPLSSSVLFAYWGVFTWLPSFLAASVERGGAGLSVLQSAAWTIPVQVGALAGCLSFGWMSDWLGRRPSFALYTAGAAVVVPLYGLYARDEGWLLVGGAALGFFGHGYYGVFGALLSELFPTGIRGLAQGLAYNLGRVASAAAPVLVGMVADGAGFAAALLLTSAGFAFAAAWVWLIPETRGRELA